MEGRLSQAQVIKALDTGHSSLYWQVPAPAGFLAGFDLDQIAADENCKKIVPTLPVQPLLFSLKKKGLQDATDIIAHISLDQWTRLLDYDVWQNERIVPHRFYAWLSAYGAIGTKQLAKRFVDLEEEYQLALLVGKFRVYTQEETETMPEALQDRLYAMPCQTVFYHILSDDQVEIEAIEKLMAALIEHRLSYAYSLVQHAAYVPMGEEEQLLRQFREARLSEDGFVPLAEAQQLFSPQPQQQLSQWRQQFQGESGSPNALSTDGQVAFLNKVFLHAQASGWTVDEQFAIHQQLLHVSNGLLCCVGVEAGDAQGLNRVLEQVRAMVGLGMEHIAAANVDQALKVLKSVPVKDLFRTGVTLIHQIRSYLVEQLEALEVVGADRIKRHFLSGRHGVIVNQLDIEYLDFFGFEVTEILKGTFNRFAMCPLLRKKDEQQPGRMEFVPIDRLALYAELKALVEGVIAVMHLVKNIKMDKPILMKQLATVCIQTVISSKVTVAPLTLAQLQEFIRLKEEDLSQRVKDLEEALRSYLVEHSSSWNSQGQIDASITAAMHIVIDSLLSVLMAAKNSQENLVSMVVLQEKESKNV